MDGKIWLLIPHTRNRASHVSHGEDLKMKYSSQSSLATSFLVKINLLRSLKQARSFRIMLNNKSLKLT